MDEFDALATEARNPRARDLDRRSAAEIVALMADEEHHAVAAVAAEAERIAAAIDAIAVRLQNGGRLLYVGAGTSGRLGALDAAECPPTFQTRPDQIQAIVAGGRDAMLRALEGVEDDPDRGAADVAGRGVGAGDAVVGISASGRTPYVLGAVSAARERGAWTAAVTCDPDGRLAAAVDCAITPRTGAEVVAGSTRLKAGTATKIVLNMLSTGALVRCGKTFGDLMVDLDAANEKLRARAARIVAAATGLERSRAVEWLAVCSGEVKTAIVAHLRGEPADRARQRLARAHGSVRDALEDPAP